VCGCSCGVVVVVTVVKLPPPPPLATWPINLTLFCFPLLLLPLLLLSLDDEWSPLVTVTAACLLPLTCPLIGFSLRPPDRSKFFAPTISFPAFVACRCCCR